LDLPGYGFAKVPQKMQALWEKQMQHYLATRSCLTGLMLITDIRRDIRPIDLDLISWCYDNRIPFVIVLNKGDKLSRNQAFNARNKLLATLDVTKDQLIICSCLKKTGIEDIASKLKLWLDFSEQV
jgi:GTP-binding protein